MSNALMVSDSISPSTQRSAGNRHCCSPCTSFQDTLKDCMATGEDEVNISSSKSSFFEESAQILPDLESLNDLLTSMTESIGQLFNENSIPMEPPVNFVYDSLSDSIVVRGERDDIDSISNLINSDATLKEGIKNVLDAGSQVIDKVGDMSFNQGAAGESEEIKKVSLVFGTNLSVMTNRHMSLENEHYKKCDAEKTEEELMFDRIKYLLTLMFIHEDPEEDEEQAKNTEAGGTEMRETVSEDDPLVRYTKLLKEIARAREMALEQNGTDKNKYALAIESYSTAMKNDSKGAEKILMNGDVVSEDESEESASV